ncbi:MAG: HAD-IC family P-type ATPase, partial [Gaiellaceae bacterium]
MVDRDAFAPGLSSAEAARRRVARHDDRDASTRSYASIVRANVFTVFNIILAAFGTLTLAFGEWRDALFLGVVVANATIGSVQEIRAKRTLDALAALVAPTATVIRDGQQATVGVDDVVVGDLVEVQPGDQFVADGTLQSSNGLQVDESVLTGESRAVTRAAGDAVRSGAFAVAGLATYLVTAAGADSYAAHVTGQARSFRHPRSPLERSLNRLLLVLVGILVPLGALLGYALWERSTALSVAVATSVAACVTLVPEGLILLASVTYAVSAMRMARRGALVQQLSAIESLAAVDVLCLDKTGTLTDPELEVRSFVPADELGEDVVRDTARAFAAASPTRNSTIRAIAAAAPADP